ncbi:MAG TPA: C-GCAxxG-C-C family (seleno)protein [Humidesulfovibrio sp.]|uniref:C-GCAxxG-C-C family (seleno)protein n=1 Tax=Humidesulfovibrio sp. TaxID=2910988 RepID=UPI002CF83BA9|nr:C-GCAxxG-C-C family (seleno)protein [Humidesulfovibrio sp.]HWR02641.1 C-GCAxxG-C-C family (seleno)protein [Humidesulfovibrio sp.]
MSSKDYFAMVAGQWDELRAGFFPDAVREKALEIAGIGAAGQGKTAADLGAGTGFVTRALLQAGLAVFAVDQSAAMLAELRTAFASQAAAGRLTALEGQAERLPLPDASVDYVFANMFLHHVDDPAKAIAEMTRILRPGGRLVLTDLDLHAHDFLLVEHHDRWPGFRRDDVAGWLAAAGLQRVRVDCCGERCCATSQSGSCDGGDKADISIFAASGRKPVLAIRPADADPLAVGARARECFGAQPALLCAESVLLAVAEGLGVASPLIPRVATGFCSGLSRTDGACGAFSGGVMALGLALGRESGADDLDETYVPVQEYQEFFLGRFGSLACTKVCGFHLGTDEGRKNFGPGGGKARCLDVVEQAAAQVVRILQDR